MEEIEVEEVSDTDEEAISSHCDNLISNFSIEEDSLGLGVSGTGYDLFYLDWTLAMWVQAMVGFTIPLMQEI